MDSCVAPAPEVVVPPGPPAADPDTVPDCPTEVHPDQLRQDWPLAPEKRARIVAWLTTMSRRGATNKKGTPVRPRHALRTMRTMGTFGRLTVAQQHLDLLDHRAAGRAYCLNDHVTEAGDLAGQRMTAEAHRRGLDCAAELDRETQDAICDAAEAELIAAGVDCSGPAPPPAVARDPRLRNDWEIPAATQEAVMERLVDMVDPEGDEAAELSERERLMAADVLALFCRLKMEQRRLDRLVHYGEPVFDHAKAMAEIEEATVQRLAERKRWREEAAGRVEGARPPAVAPA